MRTASRWCFRSAVLSVFAASISLAQDAPLPVAAGGVDERELRALQLLGKVPLRIWSIRAFNAAELATMRAGLGDSAAIQLRSRTRRRGALTWNYVPAEAGTIGNTAYPFGFNDGPLWAGRGVTGFASGGVAAHAGVLSARLSPFGFITQNLSFDPSTAGSVSLNTFYSTNIDLPQRFGTSSYGRIDPGESEVRLQLHRIAAGVSTASQVWGPGVEHPLILGNNAGGFPHAFIGTARPVNLRFAFLHTRFIWGRLDGSAFGPPTSDSRRFITAAVGAFSFPALAGLEVGAVRFFHSPWPSEGLLHAPFFNVFQGILKSTVATTSNPSGDVPGDNQLASVFFRWTFPQSGVEAYGEYGREDHNANVRDFWEEIDHDAGILLGLQRAWTRDGGGAAVFRVEHLNTRIGKLHPTRAQAPWYVHGTRVQGHTQHGQLLGSAGGFGGGGTTLAFDRFTRSGRTTLRWDRLMRAEELGSNNDHLPDQAKADVMHSLGVERMRRTGRNEITVGVRAVLDLNRDFRRDVVNLNASASYRFIH
jgi:hypothetical protein